MSIIQDIRDKYARLTVIMIALALIGFILTDYFSGKMRGLGQGSSSVIGKVNGQSINFEDFNVKVGQMEANMKQQGYPQSSGLTQQAIEQTWTSEINRILINDEFTKLGIRVGKKELGDI
jgi:peptidyl-prolyl cis-trans isomerase D